MIAYIGFLIARFNWIARFNLWVEKRNALAAIDMVLDEIDLTDKYMKVDEQLRQFSTQQNFDSFKWECLYLHPLDYYRLDRLLHERDDLGQRMGLQPRFQKYEIPTSLCYYNSYGKFQIKRMEKG